MTESSECEQIANIVCDEMSLENIEYYFTGSVDVRRRMERKASKSCGFAWKSLRSSDGNLDLIVVSNRKTVKELLCEGS